VQVGYKLYLSFVSSFVIKHQIASLDFVINRFFMKLFKTNNIEIVKACQDFFGFQLPSVQIAKRITKFEIQFQERSRLIKL